MWCWRRPCTWQIKHKRVNGGNETKKMKGIKKTFPQNSDNLPLPASTRVDNSWSFVTVKVSVWPQQIIQTDSENFDQRPQYPAPRHLSPSENWSLYWPILKRLRQSFKWTKDKLQPPGINSRPMGIYGKLIGLANFRAKPATGRPKVRYRFATCNVKNASHHRCFVAPSPGVAGIRCPSYVLCTVFFLHPIVWVEPITTGPVSLIQKPNEMTLTHTYKKCKILLLTLTLASVA